MNTFAGRVWWWYDVRGGVRRDLVYHRANGVMALAPLRLDPGSVEITIRSQKGKKTAAVVPLVKTFSSSRSATKGQAWRESSVVQNERLSATLSSGNPPLARSVGYYYGKDIPSKVPLLKSNKLFTNWRILEFILNGNLTGSRDNGACVPGKACAVATAANQYPGWLTFFFFFFFFPVQKG